MKRFIQILNWCKKHPLDNGGVHKINDYVCEHLFEKGIGFPVSKDDVACCYKMLGYDVEKKQNYVVGGHYWQISALCT